MIVKNEDLVYGGFNFDFRNTSTRFKNLDCTLNSELMTLKGLPDIIEGDMILTGCSSLTSLEYAPKDVYGIISIAGCPITSLSGIGKDYLLMMLGRRFYLSAIIKSHILGVLKIRNLLFIDAATNSNTPLYNAISIINKHLRSGKNINKCRAELEDNGLEEYAQL